MQKVMCNQCGTIFILKDLPNLKDGDIVACTVCGTEYEVIIVNKEIKLIELIMEAEDWGE